jgi:hypothetical protein
MLTDEDLTRELTLAFEEGTRAIEPAPGLAAALHRRRRRARRRATALRLALPVAAAVGAGSALIVGQPHSHAPNAQPTTTHAQRAPRPAIAAASYILSVPQHATSFHCLGNGTVPPSRDATTWVAFAKHDCLAIIVRLHVALPSDAHPADLAGVPGLYQTIDTTKGVRTIYSRNPDQHSWSAVSVAADTPDAKLVGFYVPSH